MTMNKNIKQFDTHRPLLFSIAYRMLGSAMEAEDMVQETFIRWQQVPETQVKSTKAYLSSIITRLCIDQLRSARVQREQYFGPWLPEPLLTQQALQSDQNMALAESLSMAFLVLLERLNPTERAVFLLREVFDYEYSEIASIVNKSETNCRQLVRRARQHVNKRKPRFDTSPEKQQQLLVQFMETCVNGDMPGLVNILADDIAMWPDGGGKAVSATRPIFGADKVAQFMLGVTKMRPANFVPQLAWINGQPGIIGYEDGQPTVALIFTITNHHIQAIHSIRNPDKLKNIPPLTEDTKH